VLSILAVEIFPTIICALAIDAARDVEVVDLLTIVGALAVVSAPAMDEAALLAMPYKCVVPLSRTPRPDFAYLHAELRRHSGTQL
jgi:hypothetical protein